MNAMDCGSDFLPDFFYEKDAPNVQDHLICNDPAQPNVLTHLIAVPMKELPNYIGDPIFGDSLCVWTLQNMSCARLRKICHLLKISKELSTRSSAIMLDAIRRQPGNRKFCLEKARARAKKFKVRKADPVVSSPAASVPQTGAKKKTRLAVATPDTNHRPTGTAAAPNPASTSAVAHAADAAASMPQTGAKKRVRLVVQTPDTNHRSAGTVPVPNPASAPAMARAADAPPAIDIPPALSALGPLDWDAFGRILEQRRKSIESLRVREREYVNTILIAVAAKEDVRQRMLQSWEALQRSIQVEERALEQLRAQYDTCVLRATGGAPPLSAVINVTPVASASDSPNPYKTNGLNDE